MTLMESEYHQLNKTKHRRPNTYINRQKAGIDAQNMAAQNFIRRQVADWLGTVDLSVNPRNEEILLPIPREPDWMGMIRPAPRSVVTDLVN